MGANTVRGSIEREDRILIVGSLLKVRKAERGITFSSGLPSSPTIHDFNVLAVRYSNESFQRTTSGKWKEWLDFLRAGGIALIIGAEPSVQRHSDKLVPKAFPRLESGAGQRVRWVRGTPFYEALREANDWKWNAYVPRSEERLVSVLGRNNAGDAVAFEIGVGRGYAVFLPFLPEASRQEVLIKLISEAKRRLALSMASTPIPDWMDSLILASETKLKSEAEILANRLRMLSRAKRILFEDGKPLSKECARILTEMLGPEGFSVQWREEEGAHDIEITGSTVTFVVEVRGSSGVIDVDAARQLMHHAHQLIPTTASVKGVLIGNPHRQLPLGERGSPFSVPCVELARSNHYTLLTSVQLLALYDDFVRRALPPHELVSLLLSTSLPPSLRGTRVRRSYSMHAAPPAAVENDGDVPTKKTARPSRPTTSGSIDRPTTESERSWSP